MAVQHATLDELERRRLELEGNIQTLRKSLYDWRLREAEYDGLKDEIKKLQHDCTSEDVLRIGLEYEGTVIDEKEVRDIIGQKQKISRSRDQVVSQITRRLDYVKQNVASLEKRLSLAEAELDRLLSVERPGPNAATEEYPVREIFEELDENGEVISSKVSNPADRAPEIMDMLQKAGVEIPQGQELEKKEHDKTNEKEAAKTQSPSSVTKTAAPEEEKKLAIAKTAVPPVTDSVADDFEDSDSELPVMEVDESPEDAKLRREMLEYSFHEVGKVVAELELDEEGSDVSIDEDYEYDDDDDYDEDEDEYGRTTTKVLTDEYHQQMKELEERLKAGGFINLGPAGKVEAEAKETAEAASHGGVLKVTAIERETNNENVSEAEKKPKKKVAFAEELDIAQEPKPPAVTKPKIERKIDVVKPDVAPLSESIVERSGPTPSTTSKEAADSASSGKKKTSRFKSARKDGTPTPGDSTTAGLNPGPESSILKKSDQPLAPSSISLFPAKSEGPKPFSQPIIAGDVFAAASSIKPPINREAQPPEGKITAETLVERPVTEKASVLPPDPDEIDEEIHRKEVATEFYRRRNLKIQQSGGFVRDKDDEDEADQLYELDENDQPKRKVSKFKAARLRS